MIEKLEYLLALAQEKHFGRAAEVCAVSQPSLSLGLKQLEEMLGVMLVQRGSRFIGLTPEGERTVEWARKIVSDARAMRQDIKANKLGLNGRVRIAVIPAALPVVADVTQGLSVRYPALEFTILSRPSNEIMPLLDNFEVDAAITYLGDAPSSRITTVPFYREEYALITDKDSPFANLKNVTWAQVCELPLCLLTPDTQNRRIIETSLREAGGAPRITLESDSMTVLFAHVRTGAWASVMSRKIAETARVADEFQVIPVMSKGFAHTIGLAVPAREPTSTLSSVLIAEARRIAPDFLARDATRYAKAIAS
jgi:DNA-binding transcriptional LysR family regulator